MRTETLSSLEEETAQAPQALEASRRRTETLSSLEEETSHAAQVPNASSKTLRPPAQRQRDRSGTGRSNGKDSVGSSESLVSRHTGTFSGDLSQPATQEQLVRGTFDFGEENTDEEDAMFADELEFNGS